MGSRSREEALPGEKGLAISSQPVRQRQVGQIHKYYQKNHPAPQIYSWFNPSWPDLLLDLDLCDYINFFLEISTGTLGCSIPGLTLVMGTMKPGMGCRTSPWDTSTNCPSFTIMG